MDGWLPGSDIATATAVLLLLVTLALGGAAVVRGFLKRSAARRAAADRGYHSDPFLRAVGDTISTLREKQDTLSRLREDAEQRAEAAESHSSLVLRSIPTGVITFDADLRVESVNPAGSSLLGDLSFDLLGCSCTDLYADDGGLSDAFAACLAGNGGVRAAQYHVRRHDGITLTVEARIASFAKAQGRGVLVALTDMTEAKALETRMRLKESLAAAGEMAAGLSHQIRNSLGALAGYGRLLRSKRGAPDEVDRLAGRIQDEVQELEKITRDFLRFARPEELNTMHVDLTELADEVLRTFDGVFQRSSITVRRGPWSQGTVVSIDEVLFREALTNLVRNAVEAMPSGGVLEVDVETSTDGREARIAFSDSGAGLRGKDLKELLRPFYTTKEGGTGLGLSVVEKVVALHGGRLSCWERPEGGAGFGIGIPVVGREAA